MDEYESLSHSKWECKYHVVFIPKCRRETLFGQIRQHLGEVFRKLAAQKESRIEEGHMQPKERQAAGLKRGKEPPRPGKLPEREKGQSRSSRKRLNGNLRRGCPKARRRMSRPLKRVKKPRKINMKLMSRNLGRGGDRHGDDH